MTRYIPSVRHARCTSSGSSKRYPVIEGVFRAGLLSLKENAEIAEDRGERGERP